MSEIAVGSPAPDFDLETDGGGRVSLSGLKGSKVVLYFYPKDDTPGCTKEAIAFTGLGADFKAAGATVAIERRPEPPRHTGKRKRRIAYASASTSGPASPNASSAARSTAAS